MVAILQLLNQTGNDMVKRQDMSRAHTRRGFMKEVCQDKISFQSGEANTYSHMFIQLIGCMNPESFAEFSKSPGNFATLTSNRDGYKNKQYGEKTG